MMPLPPPRDARRSARLLRQRAPVMLYDAVAMFDAARRDAAELRYGAAAILRAMMLLMPRQMLTMPRRAFLRAAFVYAAML